MRRTSGRIVVATRSIQGGLDSKFEEDPYGVDLHGVMTEQDYSDSIRRVNEHLKPSRSNAVDTALLVTGPFLVVPLAIWGARHGRQARRRKRLLRNAVEEFHATHPHLLMRWNRKPDSFLSIELRPEPAEATQAPIEAVAVADDGDDDDSYEGRKQPPPSASGQIHTGHSLE